MRHNAFPDGITRETLIDWYRGMRARTHRVFDLITPDAYYDRPIALRNPIVFYEGHLPAFSVNTLVKLALKHKGIDDRLERLFERGIDPDSEAAVKNPTDLWPAREEVQAYGVAADALIERTLADERLDDDSVPHLRGGEAVFTIIEHELLHQETLLDMFHQLPCEKKRAASCGQRAGACPPQRSEPPAARLIPIPPGRATLGAPRGIAFGWDNEFPEIVVDVGAFEIDAHNVTNGEYLEYIEATGAHAPHFWKRVGDRWLRRGLFELQPLPLNAPVYVTHEEATAYARWKGMRLPTEAEYHRAAFGTPSGEEIDEMPSGNFDFQSWDPIDVGCYPPSPFGVYDLVGNGWEWTSTPFAGFPGFEPMPSYLVYSADFFDNAHFVLKGASPVTPRELIRRSFRNWFRPNYPYVYATFRCAR